MSSVRLGDIVDDFCSRCHFVSNHSVVAMIQEEIKRVRCRTCEYEHDYRHGKGLEKKKTTSTAYDAVLASILTGKSMEAGDGPANPGKPPKKVSKMPTRTRARTLTPRPPRSR